jgi:hypothetical protein
MDDTQGRRVLRKDRCLTEKLIHALKRGNTMLLQMFLGSMNHLHGNKLESKINIPSTPSFYPLFSNRAMISPTNPLMTPSGLTAIKVCSVDISRVCCELKSLVI